MPCPEVLIATAEGKLELRVNQISDVEWVSTPSVSQNNTFTLLERENER